MNLETPKQYEAGQKSLNELNKYLSPLDKEVGGTEKKETHDVEFYKELAQKLREYGIDRIKADVAKSNLITKQAEKLEGGIIATRDILYSSLPVEVNGTIYEVNFVNDERSGCRMGWHDPSTNMIFINLPVCERKLKEDKDLAKMYEREGNLDVYSFMGGIIAHEEHHQKNHSDDDIYEEANAEVNILEIIGIPYLVMRFKNVYDEIIQEDMCIWRNVPYEFGSYKTYTELFKRYSQALKNVIKDNGKQPEFENAKKIILENLQTGWIEGNGKKERKFVEKDGKKIRQGYYFDEQGEFKKEEYIDDFQKAFAKVLTPDILKKIITEYKRLSEVK